MTAIRLVALATTVAVGAAAVTAQAPQFRASNDTVSIFTTVTDRTGRLVAHLRATDFVVTDNGREEVITVFSAGNQKLSVVLLVDHSGSVEKELPRLRAGVARFLGRLKPGDRALVATVTNTPKLVTGFTDDMETLIRALWSLQEPGNGSAIRFGIRTAMTALADRDGRRVLLVLSDGWDNSPSRNPTAQELVRQSEATNVMLYAIGVKAVGTPLLSQTPMTLDPHPTLRRLAAASGGFYFELLPEMDLNETFGAVADELHSQYEIGYRLPARDGKLHKVEVRVRQPGLNVRGRSEYTAPERMP